tara:strand:+ start:305 stop:979 length:675 start_codon:yes stop_codon:yes gene_type:complete
MIKRISKTNFGQAIIAFVIAVVIKFLSSSIRWKTLNKQLKYNALKDNEPIIVVFWHERIAVMSKIWPMEKPLAMLQSPHSDGRLIARAINILGFQTVWGSTNRNAAGGIIGLIKKAKKGVSIGITPDGPRGPALECSQGPIAVAKIANIKIFPIAWSTSSFWRLNNWDKSLVPKPFSKGIWVWGEPIEVPKNSNKDDILRLTNELNESLNYYTKLADNYFGHNK